jgi:hypothetical protein
MFPLVAAAQRNANRRVGGGCGERHCGVVAPFDCYFFHFNSIFLFYPVVGDKESRFANLPIYDLPIPIFFR